MNEHNMPETLPEITPKYGKRLNNSARMIQKARQSNIPFEDCVKIKMFSKASQNAYQAPKSGNLFFLTNSDRFINDDIVRTQYEKKILEKKLQEEKRKQHQREYQKKLLENRNSHVKNIIKDIVKVPDSAINRMQEKLKQEFNNFFADATKSDIKTEFVESKLLNNMTDESLDKIKENKDETQPNESQDEQWNFVTAENEQLKEEEPEEEQGVFQEEETEEAKMLRKKYKFLLSDSESDSDESTKSVKKKNDEPKSVSNQTKEEKSDKNSLLKVEFVEKERSDSESSSIDEPKTHKSTEKSKSAKSSSTNSAKRSIKRSELADYEKQIPEMEEEYTEPKEEPQCLELALIQQPSETSIYRLNEMIDEIKQIQLPSFQPEFHQICLYGNDAKLMQLVSENIEDDVNHKQNRLGRFSIHECCINGKAEMLKGVLCYVDNINLQDNNGQTAAHICARYGELLCLKILTANGANLMLRDKKGMQLSHLAAQFNHAEIIEFLFQMGISLKETTENGKLPLHLAAQYGSFNALKLIIDYYVDLSLVDAEGNTAAHLACIHDHLNCLKYLVKMGIPINGNTNNRGRTLAHLCCLYGSQNCLHWLLRNGADIKARDNDGNTLAHLTCLSGNAECLNCCLQHDVILDEFNYANEKPFNIARRVGKSVHIEKAVKNEIRCKRCVQVALKYRWEKEHEKTEAERTIERENKRFYRLDGKLEEKKKMVNLHASGKKRDLIAQYFGPEI